MSPGIRLRTMYSMERYSAHGASTPAPKVRVCGLTFWAMSLLGDVGEGLVRDVWVFQFPFLGFEYQHGRSPAAAVHAAISRPMLL
jgi:hypothetical protein